uniref:NB-ARC domain-containing protein n=1 Tax=Leersia perrieri TaxID=77586 RepID=A0A0D9W3R3_9ORYZ
MAASLITSLLSRGTSLLRSIKASVLAPNSSSSSSCNNKSEEERRAFKEDLERLMRTLERIRATLYDAEEREIRDCSVKLWLKELKRAAHSAEDVLSEYRYEAARAQVEAKIAHAHQSDSHKRKHALMEEHTVPIPDGMVGRLNAIRREFDEIAKAHDTYQLSESDGVIYPNNKILQPKAIDEKSIFGRAAEVTEVIDLLLSEDDEYFSVVSIIGIGGLGKTTIAKKVYHDERVRECFDLFGWVYVSEELNVEKMINETIEWFTGQNCGLSELSPLQEELAELVGDKNIFLVLDDVWNEDKHLWESFQVPFSNAKRVRVLVTTRTEKVAEVMMATACLKPNNLPEDQCWKLFCLHAFGNADYNVPAHKEEMGRKIIKKCGGLPLAVKSIAIALSLRHEEDLESWTEILESDLWESDSSNDVFQALESNYARLPAYLKPCFLLCSMFPKDYEIPKENLIELWISHGYVNVKSTEKRKIREVGEQYYDELRERSFIDCSFGTEQCKLQNVIHDFARLVSEEHWSVEINQMCDIQHVKVLEEVYHLSVRGFTGYVNRVPNINLKCFRTLSMDLRGCKEVTEHQYCINSPENYSDCWANTIVYNLAKFEALRVLELKGNHLRAIPDSIYRLKHLCHLRITSDHLEMLPPSIGLLYNLQTFILDCWLSPLQLTESIGYLINLQYLSIKCARLKYLPRSIGLLTNLLRLIVKCDKLEVPSGIGELSSLEELTIDAKLEGAYLDSIGCLKRLEELCIGTPAELPFVLGKCLKLKTLQMSGCDVIYNPFGIKNFPAMCNMCACLRVSTLAWLKSMTHLEGVLIIEGLQNTTNLEDAQNADLRSKGKIHTLDLCWHNNRTHRHFGGLAIQHQELTIRLIRETGEGIPIGGDTDVNVGLLECLQPHSHLKKLFIEGYPSALLPGWIGDPLSLQAIHEIKLTACHNLQSFPFGNLDTLKHVQVHRCSGTRFLPLEQLPSQLETLQISWCEKLESITGLWNKKMLARLEVAHCKALKSITMDEPCTRDGRRNTSSLKELFIKDCLVLDALPAELVQPGPRDVSVQDLMQ